MAQDCVRCGKPRETVHPYCRACKAAYTRDWRTKNPRAITAEERKKQNARSLAKMSVRRGQIIRNPCEKCGATENIHMHHDDYSRPKDVTWLCEPCHTALHFPKHGCSKCGAPRDPGKPREALCLLCLAERNKEKSKRRKANRHSRIRSDGELIARLEALDEKYVRGTPLTDQNHQAFARELIAAWPILRALARMAVSGRKRKWPKADDASASSSHASH
jgi:hypothetical protein